MNYYLSNKFKIYRFESGLTVFIILMNFIIFDNYACEQY